ncbi:MAG: hypothetical protein KIT33_15905, partial [Candidatus Kapabacteria bacterium]|nr:hypothetical protein [Candidatus Kapabacteria bacterium]
MQKEELLNILKEKLTKFETDIKYNDLKQNLLNIRINAIVNITPELAGGLLFNNDTNRSLNQRRVSYYAKQIKERKWQLTGDTIKFADDFTLLDGQHRLQAIILSGIPTEMEIAFGINRDTFDVIDTGKTRSAADVLSILKVKNSTKMAIILRTVIAYQRGILFSNPENNNPATDRNIITNKDIEQAYYDHPNLHNFIGAVNRNLGYDTTYSFIYYILTSKYGKKAAEFVEYLNTGELYRDGQYYRNDMMTKLREYLVYKNNSRNKKANTISTRELIGICFKYFYYYRIDRNVKTIKYSLSEGIQM